MIRTIVVTGSAAGIGRATRERLEREGARVIGVDLRDAEIQVDLSTTEGRAALVEEVKALTPSVGALVACAGVDDPDPITVRVNYFGAVASVEKLRGLLMAGVDPRVVVVASQAAIQPKIDDEIVNACLEGDESQATALSALAFADGRPRATYASSKRALCMWVRREAPLKRWAGAGIAINAVAPGIIVTRLTLPYLESAEGRAEISKRVPMPLHGPGLPEDVAALLVWLASPENRLVTGQVIFADGGSDAQMRGVNVW